MTNIIEDQTIGPNPEVTLGRSDSSMRVTASVQKLAKLREYTEASVNSMGSLEAETVILANVPMLRSIIDGSLKSVRSTRSNGDSVDIVGISTLSSEEATEIQAQIDAFMTTTLSINSLASARRLEPYLPFTFPETQAGFRTLSVIAEGFSDTQPIPEGSSLSDVPAVLKTLTRLDNDLKIAGLNNDEVLNALSKAARIQAQTRLEKAKIDGSIQISQIRAAIAGQKAYDLKRVPVEIPGTQGLSMYEVMANQIIDREDLSSQTEIAQAATEARREKEREAVLKLLAKKRATNTLAALIDSDPLLRKALVPISRMDPEELLLADPGVKKHVANNALNSKRRIIISVEDRRVLDSERLIAEEKNRISESMMDPLCFIASLTDDELLAIRQGISKSSDARSIYQLAGSLLQKQLEKTVTDDEIIEALTKVIVREMLSDRASEAIDVAITEVGIDRKIVLKDPNRLEQLREEVIARGLRFVIADALEESSAERALTIADDERRRQREISMALLKKPDSKKSPLSVEIRALLDQAIKTPEVADLGTVRLRSDIKSSLGPFKIYPEYKTTYPPVVLQALRNLFAEYNQAFRRLVVANREFDTDYQYCLAPNGTPINSFVQIDMVGLPAGFLEQAEGLREEDVREALRGRIFEIENSIAMYSLLEYFFSNGGSDTLFRRQFLAGLDDIRKRCSRPIALLAVTDQKYQAMRETEFGKKEGEPLTDNEVREFSGFDKFFSPEEFRRYVEENGGKSDYLLYVRSSDPVAKMKRPGLAVNEELLSDAEMRRIIKANSLTFNIDIPNLPAGDSRRINDTKEYLSEMGMAFPVFYGKDLNSQEFDSYLKSQGIDPSRVRSGELQLRAKPMKGTYGGYGHFRGTIADAKFRRNLRDALLERGSYVVQPELQNPTIVNKDDGQTYVYIDRVFFATDGQNYQFMGGERTLMPIDSVEAANNRIHGNSSSVYAEIV